MCASRENFATNFLGSGCQSDVDGGVYSSLRTPARKIRLGLSYPFVLLDDCEEVQPALHGAKDSR